MTDADKIKILERHVNELSEIYDAVQVVATGLAEDGSTFSHRSGSGNYYARRALCQEFGEQAAEQFDKNLDSSNDE